MMSGLFYLIWFLRLSVIFEEGKSTLAVNSYYAITVRRMTKELLHGEETTHNTKTRRHIEIRLSINCTVILKLER